MTGDANKLYSGPAVKAPKVVQIFLNGDSLYLLYENSEVWRWGCPPNEFDRKEWSRIPGPYDVEAGK